MLWIWITLAAAAVQTLRFMLQKKLASTGLSVGGATFSRFLFGAPIAVLTAVATLQMAGPLPLPGARFWAFALLGGAAQVAGTFLTVSLFKLRNFAVGVAFTKTETVQVALMSLLVLGEAVSGLGWAGIALGLGGCWRSRARLRAFPGGRRFMACWRGGSSAFRPSAIAARRWSCCRAAALRARSSPLAA